MERFIETTGENFEIAVDKALRQLNMERDDVSIEIIEYGKKGILGFGSKPMKIRVTYETPTQSVLPETPPIQKPELEEKPSAPKQEEKPVESSAVSKPIEEVAPIVSPELQNAKLSVKKKDQKPTASAPKQDKTAKPNNSQKPKRLSIATDDTTPRLVKAAPKNFVPEKSEGGRITSSRRGKKKPPIIPSTPKVRERIPVPEETMKEAGALLTEFLTGLLERMGIEGTVSVLPQIECDQLRIEISGSDMGTIIGRRGDTLDAIQYLSSLLLNNAFQEHIRLSVDTENYRAKRMDSLERLARKIAMKVVKSHRSMALEPMNPYERRIIHAALQDYNGVITYSTGTEPNRRVIIAPDDGRADKRELAE